MATDADRPVLDQPSNPLEFVKDLATYYMDFLETDFHRRRNPKRNIRLRNADNLLIGLNLARYQKFVQDAWKVILSGFSKDTLAEIGKALIHSRAMQGATGNTLHLTTYTRYSV
jgi:hypothetical protein